MGNIGHILPPTSRPLEPSDVTPDATRDQESGSIWGMDEEEGNGEDLESQRRLIASVEELRALLAPLSTEDRARVLQLARDLHQNPGDR